MTLSQNMSTFMFNSLLVELGYFEIITVGFLIIGHTHASIDQYFSCLRGLIRRANFIASPLALQHLFSLQAIQSTSKKRKYRPPILQIQLHYVHDYVKFFEPYRNKDICGYGVPYQFKFYNLLGKAVCQYKQFSDTALEWLPKPPIVADRTTEQLYRENITIIEDHLSLESVTGRVEFMNFVGLPETTTSSSSTVVEEFVHNKNNVRDKSRALELALPILTNDISKKAMREQELRRADEEDGITHIERYTADNIIGAQATLEMNSSKSAGNILC